MHGVAILALMQRMVLREGFPVFSLVGRKNARAFAQGANAIQCRQDRGPDEFRAVLHPLERAAEGFVHLEGDNFLFS
jgi:hypothetical protein